MATTGKKEYILKINGIDTAVKDVTTLEAAVNGLDTALGKVNTTNVNSTRTTREKARALSEEEKAEQKLINTIDKVVQARSDANKAQIEANIAAREAQREVTREIQIRQQAEGSIKQMGMQLTDLRNQYEGLSRAQREDVNVGGELLQQIQALDAEYKALRESTGNFRDSVGNYGKALTGLGQLSEGIEGVTKSSMGLAQGLLGANALMGLFGEQTEEDAKRAQQLQKIIALLSIAQQVNTNVLKEGIVQNKLAVVTDTIRTTQIKAKTAAEAASTKGTVAATIAQRIFNAVASANPYVLLALALVAVGAALFAFASNTDNAADKQKRLNDLQSNYLDTLENEARKTRDVSNERVTALERQLKILEAQGAKQEEIRKVEDQIAAERRRNNAYLRGFYAQEINDLDENRKMLDKYHESLRRIEQLRAEGNKKIVWDVEFDGNVEKYDVQDALDIAQSKVDEYDRKVQIAVELNTENLDQQAADAVTKAKREKEDKDRAKTAADAAKKRADTELSVVRAAEDARIKLIQNSDEQTRKTLALTYDRQIEDLRKRLATEKDLTEKARAALNETITSLEKQKGLDLEKLEKEQANRALALQQELEDSRIALIVGNYDRQTAEVNLQYDRQIEAYKKRLDEDKTLTEEQQKQITELILNTQKARGIALANLTREQLNQQADQQLTAVEDALKKVENKIGEVVVRNKTGLELIDVAATRKNLAATNAALNEYIAGLKKYLDEVRKAHEATLATLQEGTPEYEAELQKYARTVEDVTQRIKNAQKDQADNTKKSAAVQVEALRDLFGKIAEYADAAAMAVTSVMDTWNMGLQVQIDDLNEQLDALNERYEEAQKQREDAAKNVEDIEAQLQAATGGTTEALKSQLQDAMHARAEAEREEKRLAKEKEKLEADVAKKEKQMRRNDLISKIAQGFANTALGVTQALSLVFPLNFVVAGLVGAMGLIQTGIMTKQLTKLADGGEIIGPSHANGGVPIAGTNYEVEGGEFVVNKRSYGANTNLVNFINDTPRAITAADLIGVVPADTTPVIVADAAQSSEDRIIEAISGINFQPVVSVTDIADVSDEVVTVQDLAGF